MNRFTPKKRQLDPLDLNGRLAAIGVMVSSNDLSAQDILSTDIEETLSDAIIYLGHGDNEFWLFSPLLSWIAEHGSQVIVEKLLKILMHCRDSGSDVRCAALIGKFALEKGHKRWSTVVEKFVGKDQSLQVFGPADLAESLLSLRGEEAWARGSGFSVVKGTAMTHAKWTLSRKALAKKNRQYYNRLIYGAQWRADIISVYEQGARTAAEASRMSGASYEPCYRVKDEFETAGIRLGMLPP